MADRIRRGKLKVAAGDISRVANFEWNDNLEFDRTQADDEEAGVPVQMTTGGTGSFVLLSGMINSGHAAGDVVYTYRKVAVAAGVETLQDCAVTFTDVYFNTGGSVPAEGRGEIRISFSYGNATEAAPTAPPA